MASQVQSNFRHRKNLGRVAPIVDTPNLIDIQKSSYDKFLQAEVAPRERREVGLEAAIITTYRCNCRCVMCSIWKHPTRAEEEFRPKILKKLPSLGFANITGGEPFLREDISEIIDILRTKARRVVISTNGYFTERIVELCRRRPGVGVRISIEGLPAANDELRGIKDGFDHGLRTLLELQKMRINDIGFGITVSGHRLPVGRIFQRDAEVRI